MRASTGPAWPPPSPHLRRGDTLVGWRLDRLGRTSHQLVNLLKQFEREGVRLRSLQDGINPASVMGGAMLQIGAVFAEMQRNLLRERTKAGLPARARGRLGGRKPRLSGDGLDTARRSMADPLLTMEEMGVWQQQNRKFDSGQARDKVGLPPTD